MNNIEKLKAKDRNICIHPVGQTLVSHCRDAGFGDDDSCGSTEV